MSLLKLLKPVQREYRHLRLMAVFVAVVGVGYTLHWTLAGTITGVGFIGIAVYIWTRG